MNEKKGKERTRSQREHDNKGNPFAVAEQSYIEGSNETTSLPIENNKQISVMLASGKKRSRFSLMPSKFTRGTKNGPSDSKTVSSSNAERDGSKDAAKKSSNDRQIESASAAVPHVGNYTSNEMATNSVALGSASEAGPSEIQVQTHKNEKEKLFVCDVCGKTFARKDHLEEHSRTHTGDRPFVCSTCGRGFAQKSTLTMHRRTHTREKHFECEFCGNRFARKNQLVDHRRTHTGERPFKCKFCDECFAQQSSCNKHQKRKHGGM